jgi:molybdate transport system permease protein
MGFTPAEIDAILISARVASVAVVAGLPFAVLLGRYLARTQNRAALLIEVLVMLPLALPPIVCGYFLLVLFGSHGPLGRALEAAFGVHVVFTWIAAVLAAAIIGFPFMVRAAKLGFEAIDPRLELAARSLGAGRLATFATISLPLASRGIITGVVLGFAKALGEFGATIIVAGNIPGQTQTIPLLLFNYTNQPGGIAESWRLVAVSVGLAAAAVFTSEWLERRGRRRVRTEV